MKKLYEFELPNTLLNLVADILEDESIPKYEANYDKVMDADIFLEDDFVMIKIDPLKKLFVHKVTTEYEAVLESEQNPIPVSQKSLFKISVENCGNMIYKKRYDNRTIYYHKFKKLTGTENRFLKIDVDTMELFINRNISIKGIIEEFPESEIFDNYMKDHSEEISEVEVISGDIAETNHVISVSTENTSQNLVVKENIADEELVNTSSSVDVVDNHAYYNIDFFIMISEPNKKLPLFYERILIFYKAKVNINNIDEITIMQAGTDELVDSEFATKVSEIIRNRFFK